ncbi:hypothetical protein OS493_012237 [Desmophyllum pertusum]|uniref:Uncharacterized protein n=1 Tax=Desmophyllum pertusum TaxID=174260 RepID=A0A9X0A340_9CNID|nr:hypothetical protein OS493_012237 [Desmophyllum pertusum]
MTDMTYCTQPEGDPAGRRQIVHFNCLKPCHAHPAEMDAQIVNEEVGAEPEPNAVTECHYVPDTTDLMDPNVC